MSEREAIERGVEEGVIAGLEKVLPAIYARIWDASRAKALEDAAMVILTRCNVSMTRAEEAAAIRALITPSQTGDSSE